jgi:hypothetical protein
MIQFNMKFQFWKQNKLDCILFISFCSFYLHTPLTLESVSFFVHMSAKKKAWVWYVKRSDLCLNRKKKTLNVIKSTFLSLFKYFKFANKQKKLFSSYIHMSINNLYDLSKQIKYHLWEKLEKKKISFT